MVNPEWDNYKPTGKYTVKYLCVDTVNQQTEDLYVVVNQNGDEIACFKTKANADEYAELRNKYRG